VISEQILRARPYRFVKVSREDQSTVGATVRFQPDDNGKHPGEPLKAVQALLHVMSFSEPPLRLLLGSDS
jgi:hypothetical protein